MFSYCPHTSIITTKRPPPQNDNHRVKNACPINGTPASHPASLPNGLSHPCHHMNGHVVSDRHPVLGKGYEIVSPPQEISPRRSKMTPSPDNIFASQSSHDDSSRNEPRVGSNSTLTRSQSTQTEAPHSSQTPPIPSTPPSTPRHRYRHRHAEEPVLRAHGASTRASWSARARYSDSSSGESCDVGSESTDSNFSVVSARNPAKECPLSAILIGDSGTGKTCLVSRLADNVFVENHEVTVGIDFNVAHFNLRDGRPIRLQLWDTAGQEKYRAITSSYYRKAMGVVLVYDVTLPESLDNILKVWRKEVEKYAEDNVVLMLVGNKMDLDDHRTITTRRGAKVASHLGAIFFEVSAKEDLNIHSAFQAFAEKIIENVYSKLNPCLSPNAVHLETSNHDRNQKQKTPKSTCSC